MREPHPGLVDPGAPDLTGTEARRRARPDPWHKARRIGDAKRDELAVDQRQQAFIGIAGRDRHVSTEAQHVEFVDPGVIRGLGAAGAVTFSNRGPGNGWSVHLPGNADPSLGPVQRPLALAPVEAREMTARQRRPDDAVAVDVHAARQTARGRRLIDLRGRGGRRVRSGIQPLHGARKAEHGSPDGEETSRFFEEPRGWRSQPAWSRLHPASVREDTGSGHTECRILRDGHMRSAIPFPFDGQVSELRDRRADRSLRRLSPARRPFS